MPDLIDVFSQVFRTLNGVRLLLNPIWSPISKTERGVIELIRPLISEAFIETFDDHISAVNFSQRQSANRIVVLFKWKIPGWYDWKRKDYFWPEKQKKKVANYKAKFSNGGILCGNLVSLDGVLCNMTFDSDVSLFDKYDLLELSAKGAIIR